MEDYAAYLAEEARSDIVALHQFRILYDEGHHAYHFFFEGEEDALYYMPVARRHTLVKELHLYDCGGKKNVAEVREAIKTEGYDEKRCLFFIDRDFDDLLGTQISIDSDTYLTDGYSIENDVSTIESVRIILAEIIGLSQADPEFGRIENVMLKGFEEFYLEVRPLIAWIIAAKDAGCGPNLRNTIGLKGVLTFPSSRPEITKAGFEEFKKRVVVNGNVPRLSRIIHWRRALDVAFAKKWVRGKYDVWFFHTFLVATLNETSLRRKAAGARALRIPSTLREGRVFELVGGRNTPPDSLISFLREKLATNSAPS